MLLLHLLTIAAGLLVPASARNIPSQRTSSKTSTLIATQYGTVFDAPVTIGNQSFMLLVDTGSSDTYVMQTGYKCVNSTDNLVIPESDCLYANKTYHKSKAYHRVPNEMFGVEYGAGLASGLMANEQVSMGGVSVNAQKIGISNESNPMGDGVNSGLLGLGYPALTSAHPANHTSNSTYWRDRLVYNPLLFTMHEQGLIDPYFSLALAHTPQNQSTSFGGYLTLGGLPPVNHSCHFSTVPVEITENIPRWYTSGKSVLSYWSTSVRNITYGSKSNNLTTNTTSFQAFIDSGNYISYLPPAVVDPINALFSPPATFDSDLGLYVVDCSANAPKFGLSLGDQTFYHDGSDLIYQTSEGVCVSSLASSSEVSLGDVTLNIIGVPFLKNVVAVFDFGKNEMRFAKKFGSRHSASGNITSTPPVSNAPVRCDNRYSAVIGLFLALTTSLMV
ncbi:hypothetical protein N7471_002816 [Penicillium samsonianum]|uniref:uncharacterized protein n=1 Tax=Penicillium samsonianum TaxID=1882272 RepID=UPI0025483EC6|nr:uncharacterized protein N7471_002816 [Penicillium samsonianum]KAJ6143363.1 hypothetical protein N7471_002816 [Penicillium samsonianum]